MSVNLFDWIDSDDEETTEFRQAIYTLLVAISKSEGLQASMVMKGAILLAIKFHGERYTKDIDFSTSEKASEVNVEAFVDELSVNLIVAVDLLPYDLDCRVQKWEMRPPAEDATFPTLKVRVGYAYKGTKRHERLMRKACPRVLDIDYSFNEFNVEVDTLTLEGGKQIKTYSLADLVAEKYRAILQQEVRNRYRRQDPYDIYCLLRDGYLDDERLSHKVLESLVMKARSRNIDARKDSINDAEIQRRAKKEYPSLQAEIKVELPPFEEVYGIVSKYYEELPWPG